VHIEVNKRIWQQRLLAMLLFISVAYPFSAEIPELAQVQDSCDTWSEAPGHPAKNAPIQRVDHANDEADRLKGGQASNTSVILTTHSSVSLHGRARRFSSSDDFLSPQTHFFRVHQGRAPPTISPAAL
jgi:hypothetical protein